jgi:hypothetical protein
MMNISSLLVVAALILTIISAVTAKVPLWVPVLFLCLALLVGLRTL